MSTPASCLLSRLLSAHRRAGSPPLAVWPVWPDTRAERGTFDILVAQGLLMENGGAWLLTERALSPVLQMAASNRFQGLLRAAQDPAPPANGLRGRNDTSALPCSSH